MTAVLIPTDSPNRIPMIIPKSPKPYSETDIVAFAQLLIGTVAEIYTTEARKIIPCGYLVGRWAEGSRLLFGRQINTPNPAEKLEGWQTNVLAKTHRLSTNPKHLSAWQTRDFDNKLYGGAIRAGDYLLGFSGMPEHGDESLVVGIALLMGWLTLDGAAKVFKISGNEKGKEVVNWLLAHNPA
jgi:hypothetical protein